jgi:hypothetical protein
MRRLEISNISAHTFLRIEDEVTNKLSWQDKEYKELVMFLFESTPWRDKENLRLNIALSLLRGGRSSVIVLKLAFIHKKQSYGFIIRLHSIFKEAETEKNNVDKLNINSPDCFANCMGKKEIAGQYLVIYQDVGVNMVTQSIDELSESLFQRLSSQNEFTVFAHNFQKLIKDVTYSFEKIEDFKTISHDEYYDDILSQLPPELVINQAHLYQSDDLIFKSQISIFDDIKENEITDIHQFIHRLSEKKTSTQWFKLNEIWFDKNQDILTGDSQEMAYLPFTIEENSKIVFYLWIAIPKNELKDIETKLETSLDATSPCQLIFLADDVTFTAQLKKMGFDTQSCLSTLDFQALCDKYYAQLHLDMRHNDLHCGNVLTSDNSFKVIDVGDMKADLIASDIARLEVSLWYEMSKRLSEFSKQAAETIIENLMTDNVSNADSDSLSISTLFSDFLRHLKKGFKAGVQHLPDKTEIVLAYVIQILLYQRYSLLDSVDKIPVAFNVFARHWISQFRYHIDFTALSSEVREVVHHLESLVDRKRVTWEIIREAYRKSVSEMQKSQFVLKGEEQNCFEAIYRIAELPQNKENPPLVQFSCDIANQLLGPEQTLLNDLISKHFSLFCPQQPETKKASKCHITIEVSPDTFDANRYSVTVYRNSEPFLATSDPFEVTELKSILQDKLKETYSDLMTYLDSNGLNEKQVLIRFLLPRILLSEKVEQYELDGALDTWGTKFKLIISSWERRQSPKFSVPLKKCWDEYKNSLSSQIQCTNNIKSCQRRENYVPTFIVKCSDDPRRVLKNTKDSQVGVAILQFPPKKTSVEEKTDYLNVLFQSGVPIILWTREIKSPITTTENGQINYCILCEKNVHDFQKSPITTTENGQITSCMLCKKTVHDFQSYIYEKRNDALDEDEDSLHIGNHLVLLWDEPELRLDEQIPLRGAK